VGAHNGGEILEYAKRKLKVLWVEANPEIFPNLVANLRGVPRQKAILGLVGHENKENRQFFLASNDGASSSVFPLEQHASLWPEIRMKRKIMLPQLTLPDLLSRAGFRLEEYDTLVLDVQGAELDIIKGIPLLADNFSRLQVEAANFPLY
jgi:FkbM family methyltransferase